MAVCAHQMTKMGRINRPIRSPFGIYLLLAGILFSGSVWAASESQTRIESKVFSDFEGKPQGKMTVVIESSDYFTFRVGDSTNTANRMKVSQETAARSAIVKNTEESRKVCANYRLREEVPSARVFSRCIDHPAPVKSPSTDAQVFYRRCSVKSTFLCSGLQNPAPATQPPARSPSPKGGVG